MTRLKGFGTGQRMVVVIGLGAALYVIGDFVTRLGSAAPTGWTGYQPLVTRGYQYVGSIDPLAQLLVWLLLVVLWVGGSLFILGQRSDAAAGAPAGAAPAAPAHSAAAPAPEEPGAAG